MIMYLKAERIRRETEKAYLIQCPTSSYSYAKAGFWMSKSQVKRCQYGDYEYVQANIPAIGEVEAKRFISKRRPSQVFHIPWRDIQLMFQTDHDLVMMRLQFERQNQAADRAFEQQFHD